MYYYGEISNDNAATTTMEVGEGFSTISMHQNQNNNNDKKTMTVQTHSTHSAGRQDIPGSREIHP